MYNLKKKFYDGNDESIIEKGYSGLSTFGVIMADIKAIIGIIIGIILLIAGIICIRNKTHRTSTVNGIILNTSCVNSTNKSSVANYNCSFDAKYTINGKDFTKHFDTTDSDYKNNNDTIVLYYDPSNIDDISTMSDNLHVIGWFLIILAILIAISSIVWAVLANKFKPVAAISGLESGFDMLTGRGF